MRQLLRVFEQLPEKFFFILEGILIIDQKHFVITS